MKKNENDKLGIFRNAFSSSINLKNARNIFDVDKVKSDRNLEGVAPVDGVGFSVTQ